MGDLSEQQLTLLLDASKQEAYSRKEVAKLFGLPESRLRSWEKSGFLKPTASAGRRARYTFQDLIEVRAAKGLIDHGVSLRKMRQAIEALRKALPLHARPLVSCRLVADGPQLSVRDDAGTYSPVTGQCLFEFDSAAISSAIVTQLRPPSPKDIESRAYDAYLEAIRLEDAEESTPQAIEDAYRRALAFDPNFVSAMNNLANHLIGQNRQDEALSLYHQALKQDPQHPETLFNLGLHYLDDGELTAAAEAFMKATQHAHAFADAHFNLAMVLEEMGDRRGARPHWERFLELEPEGALATVASRHLAE